jgi:hypothetical protein
VYRLILLVIGVGNEYRGEPVEGEHAVGLGVRDRLDIALVGERLVVGMRVVQGPGRLASQDDLI